MNQQMISKYKLIAIIVALAAVCFAWSFFSGNPVLISHESGFYEKPFYLSLSLGRGESAYYTLDGSLPTKDSLMYTEPIYIDDASLKENVFSMNTDVSTGFRTDLIEKLETIDDDPEYQAPDYLVDKCTVMKILVVRRDGQTELFQRIFFVGENVKKYNTGLVLSLVCDPDDLFGSEKGIYVTGNFFEDYLANNSTLSDFWRKWDANYYQRGKEWERPSFAVLFDSKGKKLFEKTVGIRIKGGVSRSTLPKSLNLYAKDEYDGEDLFDIDLFGNGYKPQRISLDAGGDQTTIQLVDKMVSDRAGDLKFATMNYIPCTLYINGEYWGFYYITEKYDEEYISYYYNLPKSDIVMIKNSDIEEGKEEDFALYDDMIQFITSSDMSEDENYQKACSMIDMDSYIDYYATLIYLARCQDWPFHNFAMWRSKDVSAGAYEDGRWRWMLFDCNSASIAFEDGVVTHNTLEHVGDTDPIFGDLWENDTFKARFKDRFFEIADTCFASEEMEDYIDAFQKEYEDYLRESWRRFYGESNDQQVHFDQRIADIKGFFRDRREVVESWEQWN